MSTEMTIPLMQVYTINDQKLTSNARNCSVVKNIPSLLESSNHHKGRKCNIDNLMHIQFSNLFIDNQQNL